MNDSDFFCSAASAANEEPLLGSASEADVWLMLEYNGPWHPRAFEESLLAEQIKAHLAVWLEQFPSARLLLIRQPPAHHPASFQGQIEGWIPNTDGKISFFAAIAGDSGPALYGFWLPDYTGLLEIDLQGLVEGGAGYERFRLQQPLILVCTHGKRDRCCSLYGFDIYRKMAETAAEQHLEALVWQSSHVGGHRFAANVVVFPEAVYYGRLEAGEAPLLMAAARNGEMYLEKVRGRASYARPVQAAEVYLRRKTGNMRLNALRLVSAEEIGGGEWRVEFASQPDGLYYVLRIGVEETQKMIATGCNSDKTVPLTRYSLLEMDGIESEVE